MTPHAALVLQSAEATAYSFKIVVLTPSAFHARGLFLCEELLGEAKRILRGPLHNDYPCLALLATPACIYLLYICAKRTLLLIILASHETP